MWAILFIFGAAVGSFLNVVSMRYEPDRFMFGRQILGRSHCPSCGKKLSPFELVPVLSFIIQLGHCRGCGAKLSPQYPIVEILSGLIFVFVPAAIKNSFLVIQSPDYYLLSIFWVLIFELLLLLAIIDLRLSIIPDEINILLVVLGILVTFIGSRFWELSRSFVGPYSLIFGLRDGAWLNHVSAALIGFLLLGLLIVVTRGRGMGIGDLKLVFPLGLIFGWPEIVFVLGASFVIGSFAGVFVMFLGKKTMKSAIPFGPFLALGATTIFFFGEKIFRFYFGLFRG